MFLACCWLLVFSVVFLALNTTETIHFTSNRQNKKHKRSLILLPVKIWKRRYVYTCSALFLWCLWAEREQKRYSYLCIVDVLSFIFRPVFVKPLLKSNE